MRRPVAVVVLSALTLGAVPMAAAERPGWIRTCTGAGDERQCTLSLKQSYLNNRGGRNEATLIVRRQPGCLTLHVTFDAPIALDLPVALSVDGGPSQVFYTEGELTRLARAVDAGQEPDWGPAEFQGFYSEIKAGTVASAGNELVARFARVKESRRLGLACAATERLLPELRNGRTLTLAFHTKPRGGNEIYHWPRLTAREVSVPLEGLLSALDRTSETH